MNMSACHRSGFIVLLSVLHVKLDRTYFLTQPVCDVCMGVCGHVCVFVHVCVCACVCAFQGGDDLQTVWRTPHPRLELLR